MENSENKFILGGNTYMAVHDNMEGNCCKHCVFTDEDCEVLNLSCSSRHRIDKKDIYWVEVYNDVKKANVKKLQKRITQLKKKLELSKTPIKSPEKLAQMQKTIDEFGRVLNAQFETAENKYKQLLPR